MTGFGLWDVRRESLEQSARMAAGIRGDEGRKQAGQLARRGSPLSDRTFSFATRIGSTAIVPVLGPLMSRMSWFFWSYDEIIRDVQLALDDDEIERIVLDVDSPGGMVAGCDDCAAWLRLAGDIKPILAHTQGLMASAAYWIGSTASEIVASPSANIGSVGAIIRYVDIEGIFEKMGARVIEVVAEQSPNKALDPESEEGRAELQAIVDGAADLFIDGLAGNRGVSRKPVLERFGRGLVFKATEALERGMIDEIQSLDSFLAGVADRELSNRGPVTAAAPEPEGDDMDWKDVDLAGLREHCPDLVTSIEASARAEVEKETADDVRDAAAAASTEERERILAIEAAALPGHDELVATAKRDGMSVAEFSTTLLKAEKDRQAKAAPVEGLRTMDNAVGNVGSSATGTGEPPADPAAQSSDDASGGSEDDWRKAYETDAKIRAEYPSADAYVGYRKASRDGKFKVLSRR